MGRHIIMLMILFLTVCNAVGQEIKTPKNIKEAISILYIDCSDSLKTIIKRAPNDQLIDLCYPWKGNYKTIFQWTNQDNKKSRIRKYLLNNGISYNPHQQSVILIAFKKYLNEQAVDEKEIFAPYQKIEKKWADEDKVRTMTDSLRGVYIPKNLDDCFKQIDSFWDDSTKTQVKRWTEDEFSAKAHFGFGMWMRNNWQLWGGSRLSKYFNEMGIFHPEDMSGIILDSYYRYLTGQEIKLEEQILNYQEYWQKANQKSK